MDIYCPLCGKPWDMEELHHVPMSFGEARRRFAHEGCRVFDEEHSTPISDRAKSAVLFELLGEDIDGIAALMDDIA